MIIVKRATLNELESLSHLFNKYRVFYGQKSDLGLAHDFLTERISNNESVVLVAQNEHGNDLGFVQLYPSFSSVSAARTWILNDLFVASATRRQGVAKLLMTAAKEHAVKTNAVAISLETAADNYAAQGLYESLGYIKGNGVHHYYLGLLAD